MYFVDWNKEFIKNRWSEMVIEFMHKYCNMKNDKIFKCLKIQKKLSFSLLSFVKGTYVCMYVCMYVYMRVYVGCVCVFVCVCMYVCIYVCIYVLILLHDVTRYCVHFTDKVYCNEINLTPTVMWTYLVDCWVEEGASIFT